MKMLLFCVGLAVLFNVRLAAGEVPSGDGGANSTPKAIGDLLPAMDKANVKIRLTVEGCHGIPGSFGPGQAPWFAKAGSAEFIPSSERVAVFDNDGTLWPENPAPFQFLYAVDALTAMLPERPELADDPMVKAALAGDAATLLADHYKGWLAL